MILEKMLEENPYELNHDNDLIACVGTNGGTTDESIREGFKETVEVVLKLMYQSESDLKKEWKEVTKEEIKHY